LVVYLWVKNNIFFLLSFGIIFSVVLIRGQYLGYDTGIYRHNFILISDAIYNGHFGGIFDAIKSEPPGLYGIVAVLSYAGISVDNILVAGFGLSFLFLGISLYFFVKNIFGKKSACLTFFLFATSIIQLESHFFMLFKSVFSLIFGIWALYFLVKNKYLLSSLFAVLAGLIHPLAFMFFIFGLMAYYIIIRDKSIILAGLMCLASLALIYNIYNHELIIGLLSNTINHSFVFSPNYYGGKFYGLSDYFLFAPHYIVFAIYGAIILKKKKSKEGQLLIGMALIILSLILFKFYFYNRLIIYLDIIVLMLAGLGLENMASRFDKKTLKIVLSGAFTTLLTVMILFYLFSRKPEIISTELEEIKSLCSVEQNVSVFITEPRLAPWAYGYSCREVIAPNIFGNDKFSTDDWNKFWESGDLGMLSIYKKPIYIVAGKEYAKNFNRERLAQYGNIIYRLE